MDSTDGGWPIGGNGKYKKLFSFLIFLNYPGLFKKGLSPLGNPLTASWFTQCTVN